MALLGISPDLLLPTTLGTVLNEMSLWCASPGSGVWERAYRADIMSGLITGLPMGLLLSVF